MKLLPFRRSFFLPLFCGAVLPLLAAAAVRAQTPGDVDPTFAAGTAANGSVHAIALQANGQVVVGGQFSTYRGANRNSIARLNADGSLDTTFSPGLAISYYNGYPNEPLVQTVAVQADGKIFAGGNFSVLNQPAGNSVVRLNPDGSLDSTFNVGTGVIGFNQGGNVQALSVLPNGQILVGGSFTQFNGLQAAGLVRLEADGSLDPSFNPEGVGITGNPDGSVQSIVVQGDGRIVIGGYFSAYDGMAAGCVARLNADGTLDPTFDVGMGAGTSGVFAVGVQADGKVIVGGNFNSFDNLTVPHLVRLNTDGSLDTGYSPNGGLFIEEIDALLVQPDGSTLIGGEIRSNGGLLTGPTDGLARILADGTEDANFGGTGNTAQIAALLLQPDGKLLVTFDQDGFLNQGPGDVYRAYDVAPTPTVTIASGAKKIYESGSKGPATFIVNISAAPTSKLTIKYTLKGSAISGFDYEAVSGKVKIKPNHTSATISVYPKDQGINDGSVVALKAILLPGTGYTVGSPGAAKDKIIDNR